MKTLQQLACTNRIVHEALHRGLSETNIIELLVTQNEKLIQRIIELESIAPKKVTLPNGKTLVWRCPDDLIPTTKL